MGQPTTELRSLVLASPGGLGDTILFSPVLRAARRRAPGGRITLVVASPLARDLYAGCPEIDHIELLDTNRKLAPALYAQLLRLALASRRNGGADELVSAARVSPTLTQLYRWVFAARHVLAAPAPPASQTDLDVNTGLAQHLWPATTRRDVFVPDDAAAALQLATRLGVLGVAPAVPLIAVYPSVERPNRPRWPLRLLAGVAGTLAQELHGRVAIIGGARDGRDWAEACGTDPAVLNLAGQQSLREIAALLRRARLAICNDGGLMHLAGAVDAPLVALMPNTPPHYIPPGRHVVVVTPPCLTCFPCYPRRPQHCRAAPSVRCLDAITPDTVLAAARGLLNVVPVA